MAPSCPRTGLSHISGGEFDFFTAVECALSGGSSSPEILALFVFGGIMVFFTALTRSFKLPAVMLAVLGSVFVSSLAGPAVGMAVILMILVVGGGIFYLMTKSRGTL